MKFVDPIYDENTRRDIANYLKKKNKRDAFMFLLGINVGCRISDILSLRVCDLKGKERLCIIEQKTGKPRYFKIPPKFNRDIVQPFLATYEDTEQYIFKSRTGEKPITRCRAWKIIHDAGRKFGVKKCGSHTLRKTFGYIYYKKYGDVAELMKIFNHSKEEITLRYIGVQGTKIEEHLDNLHILDNFNLND